MKRLPNTCEEAHRLHEHGLSEEAPYSPWRSVSCSPQPDLDPLDRRLARLAVILQAGTLSTHSRTIFRLTLVFRTWSVGPPGTQLGRCLASCTLGTLARSLPHAWFRRLQHGGLARHWQASAPGCQGLVNWRSADSERSAGA